MLPWRRCGHGKAHCLRCVCPISPTSREICLACLTVSSYAAISQSPYTSHVARWVCLSRVCAQPQDDGTIPDNAISSISISNDGRLIAAGSMSSGFIEIWTTAGTCIWRFKGHANMVLSTQFSTHGQMLASWSYDRIVKVWNVVHCVCIHSLGGHAESISTVSFSEDDRYIATGSYDKTIKLWDAVSGFPLHSLEGHRTGISALALSANKMRLISGSMLHGELKIWDLVQGICLQTFEGHHDSVLAIALSADGRRLATSSCDKSIKVWDLEAGAVLTRAFYTRTQPTFLAFNPSAAHSLDTNLGVLNVDPQFLLDAQSTDVFFDDVALSGWGCDFDTGWVLKDGNRICPLPEEYLPSQCHFRHATLAVVGASGRLLLGLLF